MRINWIIEYMGLLAYICAHNESGCEEKQKKTIEFHRMHRKLPKKKHTQLVCFQSRK